MMTPLAPNERQPKGLKVRTDHWPITPLLHEPYDKCTCAHHINSSLLQTLQQMAKQFATRDRTKIRLQLSFFPRLNVFFKRVPLFKGNVIRKCWCHCNNGRLYVPGSKGVADVGFGRSCQNEQVPTYVRWGRFGTHTHCSLFLSPLSPLTLMMIWNRGPKMDKGKSIDNTYYRG